MWHLVCYTAVFSVVTQRSSPLSGEEHCVTTLKNGCVADYVALELVTLFGVSSNYDSWYVSVTDFSWPAPFQSGSLTGYLCLVETVSVPHCTEPITRQHSVRPKRSASFASLERRCAARRQYSVPCVGVVVSLIFVALILDFFNNLCLRFVLFNEANRLHLDVCWNP